MCSGINFRDAGASYMSPHGMPGGGDWGLQSPQYAESGAVYLSGTANVTFDSCVFKYLEGNGVFIAGWVPYSAQRLSQPTLTLIGQEI